ncbi:GINS complex subunit [Mortierella polycephala]|uniref:GINS complex subunit n=1 Tax=Mortierella polycephala TaxID=41804 RepID=A0A9P6PVN2_9FUNG|nr:GINS complex subunit [Mortierella polycephala]
MSVDDDLFSEFNDFNGAAPAPLTRDEIDPTKYVKFLTQAWINERAAPDILKYEQASVDGLLAKIDEQTMVIDELDSGKDTSVIISILYQTELERIKFVLRSYLRTRISKIEKYCQFILADTNSKRRLSKAEILYAEKPSLDEAVFCRVVEDVGDFRLDE